MTLLIGLLNPCFAGELVDACPANSSGTELKNKTAVIAHPALKIADQIGPCAEKTNLVKIKKIIDDLIKGYFPRLKDAKITVSEFKSEAYYLQTGFGNIFAHAWNRNFTIEINPKLYKCPPPPDALRAILAHELFHIQDYRNRSTFGMIGLGLKYTRNSATNSYERSADERVLQLGKDFKDPSFFKGIKEYRQWIYPKLNEKELKTKKERYFTPEEVDKWVLENVK
ncbi:MAG: hypothetical protein HN509_00450 [Halobacteriovoraceae bacterium]|jgi:hypothetical protein|nr:hypothetical protein [Halobacteriovoraceae bacterium]MBT5093314.1 hypothetical protein [Halobacteriovoraceae bacterium]